VTVCHCNCHVPDMRIDPHANCGDCQLALIEEASDLGWREGLERAAMFMESRKVLASEFYGREIRKLVR
jgi:hypothetical protein